MTMGWNSTFAGLVRDERLHAAAICLTALGIVSTMLTVLGRIRDCNQIAPEEPKTQYITQETEDSLPAHTLETLLRHPNPGIRDVSSRIVCDRAMNNTEALNILLHGLAQEQYECRIKSLRALELLTSSWPNHDCLVKLHEENAYFFLVQCLKHCVKDCPVPDLSDSHWDEYNLRDKAERLCLTLAVQLCSKFGARKLAKAGFVEKWLGKQDWGSHQEMRQLRFAMYMARKKNRIVDLVYRLRQSRTGIRALRKTNLLQEPSRQFREGSVEQRRLRRQHREAMVLNDGTRPLGQADIIEREHDSPP